MVNLRPSWLKLQPSWLKGKDIPEQLEDVVSKLLHLPSSTHEVLLILDQGEHLLSKVEQSPPDALQEVLSTYAKLLIQKNLLEHPNNDVRIAVITCICELTRITAPILPYEDDQMKEIFELIVFSLGSLSNPSNGSYTKAVNILNIVAGCRVFVLMLDLECDDLIRVMFRLFLTTITFGHPPSVFEDMESIMSILLDESDAILAESIYPLFECLADCSEVTEIGRQLVKKVLHKCSTKREHILTKFEIKTFNEDQGEDYVQTYPTTIESELGYDTQLSKGFQLPSWIDKPIVTMWKWSSVPIQISKYTMLRPTKLENTTIALIDGSLSKPFALYHIDCLLSTFKTSNSRLGIDLKQGDKKHYVGIYFAPDYGFAGCSIKYEDMICSRTTWKVQDFTPVLLHGERKTTCGFATSQFKVEPVNGSVEFNYSLPYQDVTRECLICFSDNLCQSLHGVSWNYFHSWKKCSQFFVHHELLNYLFHGKKRQSFSIRNNFWRYLTFWKNCPKLIPRTNLLQWLIYWDMQPKALIDGDSWKFLVHWTGRPDFPACDMYWKYLVLWMSRSKLVTTNSTE